MEHWDSICIVGLGLMGGSAALALRTRSAHERAQVSIAAVDRNREALDRALAAGVIDAGTTDLKEGLKGARTVLLATPVRTILRLLPDVGRFAEPDTLVMDLGSSKAEVCKRLEELPPHLHPIGGHPMCGREVSGFAAADPQLFAGRPFVLCPLARTSPQALARAVDLVEFLGSQPLIVDPGAHDRAAAAISHLPYAVAVSLVRAVTAEPDPLAQALASSGYRDTTRVAGTDVDVMLDTLLTNRAAVLDWIGNFSAHLEDLRAALAAGDEASLRKQMTEARERRNVR